MSKQTKCLLCHRIDDYQMESAHYHKESVYCKDDGSLLFAKHFQLRAATEAEKGRALFLLKQAEGCGCK